METTMNKLTVLLTVAWILSSPAYGHPALPGATATADPKPHAEQIEPAAVDLAKRAEAGDQAFVANLMDKDASPQAVADMIARLKRADVRRTFRAHLEARGPGSAKLNYHDPSHVQVDLRKGPAGKWEVARLWFCR
jgi:hypothetical protein